MANRYRNLPYVFGFLIIILLLARTIQTYSYMSYAFIQTGLFNDQVCSRGSYEIIVCPYSLPPYETYLAILAILLVLSLWAARRK